MRELSKAAAPCCANRRHDFYSARFKLPLECKIRLGYLCVSSDKSHMRCWCICYFKQDLIQLYLSLLNNGLCRGSAHPKILDFVAIDGAFCKQWIMAEQQNIALYICLHLIRLITQFYDQGIGILYLDRPDPLTNVDFVMEFLVLLLSIGIMS